MSERTLRSIVEGQPLLTAPVTATVAQAARLMREANAGGLLVVDGVRLAGVFTERDALFRVVAEGRDANATPLAAVMTPQPRTLPPEAQFAQALSMMHEGGFRHVPVVEDGRLLGVVSARDALGPELEAFIYELLRQEQVQDVLA